MTHRETIPLTSDSKTVSNTEAPAIIRNRPAKNADRAVTFADLNLAEPVQRALDDSGYTTPTPVQGSTIPATMSGRDVLGIAQTGTGKTAAFALPIIHRLLNDGQAPRPTGDEAPRKGKRRGRRAPAFLPRALILSPTRELATQITKSFETYGKHTKLRHTAIYGGVSQFRQEQALERGVDIIVATPGRLIDLMDQGLMDFSAVRTLVLDEADRMLDMGFINPIRDIAAALPEPRQTLLFSATMPPAIAKLAETLLTNPVRVEVPGEKANIPKIEQSVMMITPDEKQPMLERMLNEPGVERAVVFTKTKHGADRLCKKLAAADIESVSIHGNKTQAQRDRALDAFRRGRSRVLVATDVAARGLDVTGVTHVFNFDLPLDPEAYVHRIGRTGRAGKAGVAVAFCTPQERGLLKAIERQIGERINGSGSAESRAKPKRPRRDDERPRPATDRVARAGAERAEVRGSGPRPARADRVDGAPAHANATQSRPVGPRKKKAASKKPAYAAARPAQPSRKKKAHRKGPKPGPRPAGGR